MHSTEFINRLTQAAPRDHRILPPLEDAELDAWCERWPQCRLPEDLLGLLRKANGIQFWVHRGSPDGCYSLLPLREIDSARRIMWGESGEQLKSDEVPRRHWLAITQHQDGACYVVLDTDEQRYYLMDTCGADLTCPVGNSVSELLDFIWDTWVKALGDAISKQDSLPGNWT
jgi:hypothetical protein